MNELLANEELKLMNKKINRLLELVGTPKQWLNINEVSHYLGYSKESIYKMVKSNDFKQGIHYHKKFKKLLFNKNELDKWVIGDSPINYTDYNSDEVVKDILSSIAS